MSTFSKIKWTLGISMVFVLIAATNLIDRNNFVQVRDSVTTIYEDRLVAKYLIFEMAEDVHKLELAIVAGDSISLDQEFASAKESMQSLVERFEQTKLTRNEKALFNKLKSNLTEIEDVQAIGDRNQKEIAARNLINRLKQKLSDLSDIQLSEGEIQLGITKKAVQTVELFSNIEIYLLIFLAVVIQIIILYDPKRSKEETRS